MKKFIPALAAAIMLMGVFTSCNNAAKQTAAVYQCPMNCEGDKTYDAVGKCAVCGMDLEEVKK